MTTFDVKPIAFYLPQFHPIPENDEWWGKGFTEWFNVVKARPQFAGHYQPHLPADLGFYDLRVAETREAQAALAHKYGIYGFCYYYYWFSGHRLLERPLLDVLHSRKPDFPFCVCWANETWTRRWDSGNNDPLIKQSYSDADDISFIESLLPFFADPRYITIGSRPLLIVYRLNELPDPKRTVMRWCERVRQAGLSEPYVCCLEVILQGKHPNDIGADAAIEFPPHDALLVKVAVDKIFDPRFQGAIYDYVSVAREMITRPHSKHKLFRGVMVSWDNTARRPLNPDMFLNSHPKNYERWLREIIKQARQQHALEERFVFINAWNEWAEGCHLEPDQVFGHAYLEATSNALLG